MFIEWISTLPADLTTVSATAVASGAISSARYVFYSVGQKRRSSCLSRCLSAGSLALAGGVIGSACAAMLYRPDNPLQTFGLSVTLAACIDPMNLASTRQYLLAVARALASLPQLQKDGAAEPSNDLNETCGGPRGQSSSSEDQQSEPAQ